jgi:hypothetical protein
MSAPKRRRLKRDRVSAHFDKLYGKHWRSGCYPLSVRIL